MPTAKTIENMPLDGGIACLDFVNSGFDTEKDTIVERLRDYSDLLTLSERLSLLDKEKIGALRILSTTHIEEGERVLTVAREVRQVFFKVFTALATGMLDKLNQEILKAFNGYISRAYSNQSFFIEGSQLKRDWKKDRVDLWQPLWAFLLSAHDLLVNRDQQYIKKCRACEWLFIDETKNHRRKWCDMQACGSLEKSKRYYQRKKLKKT
ncbi:CGNR zinc finger domain-containing protein [Olivibacter sp. SDN3]|uniref:CGNR zinc finger domain-containing protein n=1 Tax=Olivibacter sp. SDN3 TaxID=2764720 RepID=UPI0016514740|nr:CGNR zinc finger domain-containing protein [Olivibacter sp. SDN3]QNL51854.1 CGNR zinc finger domain-containing protein [Olivibacter sp. SDN3]